MTERRLLVSIHDVTPAHADRIERLIALAERYTGAGRYGLLVVPDYHRRARLDPSDGFGARLKALAAAGCAIFLHGFSHKAEASPSAGRDRWRAKHMTGGEGEFLGLGSEEATRRLREGRALVETAVGRPVDGFIAPAWLYDEDAKAAVAGEGFPLAEDHFRVWRPQDGRVLAKGPVISWASRSRARLASSLLWSSIARVVLARSKVVRIALHPGDADHPVLMRDIERTLARFARSHRPASYCELTTAP